MKLPPEAIKELQELYFQKEGICLSWEEASEMARRLLVIYRTGIDIYQATQKKGGDAKSSMESTIHKP